MCFTIGVDVAPGDGSICVNRVDMLRLRRFVDESPRPSTPRTIGPQNADTNASARADAGGVGGIGCPFHYPFCDMFDDFARPGPVALVAIRSRFRTVVVNVDPRGDRLAER